MQRAAPETADSPDTTKSCGLIVISGSGTSGRLAFLVALEFNRILKQNGLYPCFRHLIAGGDEALLKSVESAEATSSEAVRDLKTLIEANDTPVDRVVYVGVTCGLSATYVGAQLEYSMQQSNDSTAKVSFKTILLGFNPVGSVKPLRIANWKSTFHSVVNDLDALAQSRPDAAVIVNPCVGPETICGSTRMKGGSATKILLETMAAAAVEQFQSSSNVSAVETAVVAEHIKRYRTAYLETYQSILPQQKDGAASSNPGSFTQVVDAACDALKNSQGRVVYLGRGNAGILGVVDASECPPTYNAHFEDIRGFLLGGWPALYHACDDAAGAATATDTLRASFASRIPISVDAFFGHLRLGDDADSQSPHPRWLPTDLIVVLDRSSAEDSKPFDFARQVLARLSTSGLPCKTAVLGVHGLGDEKSAAAFAELEVHLKAAIPLSIVDTFADHKIARDGLVADFAAKLMLNAVSTIAHVQKGTIFTNRMVNLRVSNVKLFHRAVGLVSQLGRRPIPEVHLPIVPHRVPRHDKC